MGGFPSHKLLKN